MALFVILTGIVCFLLALFSPSLDPILQKGVIGLFFVGYFLMVDGLCSLMKKKPFLGRSYPQTLALFFYSVGFWVFFSTINVRWELWHNTRVYETASEHFFYWLYHAALLPAFFATYTLFEPPTLKSRPVHRVWAFLGIFCLVMPFFTVHLYPLFFLAPFLLIDPVNAESKLPSVISLVEQKKFKIPFLLGGIGVFLGLLYESVNFYLGFLWKYHFAYASGWSLFGMPLTGYLGYFVFGWDLFAVGVFFLGLTQKKQRI